MFGRSIELACIMSFRHDGTVSPVDTLFCMLLCGQKSAACSFIFVVGRSDQEILQLLHEYVMKSPAPVDVIHSNPLDTVHCSLRTVKIVRSQQHCLQSSDVRPGKMVVSVDPTVLVQCRLSCSMSRPHVGDSDVCISLCTKSCST